MYIVDFFILMKSKISFFVYDMSGEVIKRKKNTAPDVTVQIEVRSALLDTNIAV